MALCLNAIHYEDELSVERAKDSMILGSFEVVLLVYGEVLHNVIASSRHLVDSPA